MKSNKKKIVSVVVALAVVLAVFGIFEFLDEIDVESIIQLDVNPSIELQVDDDAEVIRAVALNQDAEKVLEGMKLRDTDVDTAVNAIVGSLLKQGYVDELANSILLTVEDENTARGAKLKEELTAEISAILGATSINASILAQQVEDAGVTEMADELDISKGKATLIQNILEVNNTYDAKDLAKLSVNELNLVLSNPKNEVKDVVSTGSANDSAYIGRDKAKEAAFAHASVKESDVRDLEVDFDYEYGKMVYEVEFASGEYEYDYSIDAENGEVLHSHREYDDDYVAVKENTNATETQKTESSGNTTSSNNATSNAASSNETKDIGKEKAKAITFEHAGTTESNVTRLTVEREYDDGKLEYHVDFNVGNKEYDYEISAETGKILDYDVDVENDKKATTSSNTSSSNKTTSSTSSSNKTSTSASSSNASASKATDIGAEKAKAIALDHAGTKESATTRLTVEKEYDDGKLEYHVDFNVGNKEYDYEISAETGKILDYSVDVEDDKKTTTSSSSSNKTTSNTSSSNTTATDIGREKAKSAALAHAGLKESQVTRLNVERDVDDGRIEYSVEFTANGNEYDYEISGADGKILDYDVERADND